jgi:hypothetical protein
MLERLFHGWTSKFVVLVLLGFAATDFVITKTLSAADAAEHLIHNPFWHSSAPEFLQSQLIVTMILLVLLGAMFLRGFQEVIMVAVVIVGVYLFLNLIVISSGLVYLIAHPDMIKQWFDDLHSGNWELSKRPIHGIGWGPIIAICLLYFPKLALGLSGFETGVSVMPLVSGNPDDDPTHPKQRIRNTRKLLTTAALIMSVLLLGSSFVTTMLIPARELQGEGHAVDRALAFLAHGEGRPNINVNPLFGDVFGTIYDVATVAILWFAGASAMSGLLNLVPRYLPRYGMAPRWAAMIRPLVILFTLMNLLVTWIFNASVRAQSGAYATGVMVLMSSAALAVIVDQWRLRPNRWILFRIPWNYVLVFAVFCYTTVAISIEKPDGIRIAAGFIFAILAFSILSRSRRSMELRFEEFLFVDNHSRLLWDALRFLEFPVLVPHRPGTRSIAEKEAIIREAHRLNNNEPIVFVEVRLGDPSEFAFEPGRVCEFARDLANDSENRRQDQSWSLILASLRAAFKQTASPYSPNGDLNVDIAAANEIQIAIDGLVALRIACVHFDVVVGTIPNNGKVRGEAVDGTGRRAAGRTAPPRSGPSDTR